MDSLNLKKRVLKMALRYTLKEVARKHGMDPDTFSRKLREQGVSFSAFRLKLRRQYVENMLRQGALTSEIARRLRIAPGYLARWIRKEFGLKFPRGGPRRGEWRGKQSRRFQAANKEFFE